MLIPLQHFYQIPAFVRACSYEHVFGSRALTALRAYGIENSDVRFFLCGSESCPEAALCLQNGLLSVASEGNASAAPIVELCRQIAVREIHTDFELCLSLKSMLGGRMDSSCYMVYGRASVQDSFPELLPADPQTIFSVLQRSHEYYRTHLNFDPWGRDLRNRLSRGLSELYQLKVDGETVGTGSIASEDDSSAVIAAVAVLPEYRRRGLGSCITSFLTKRILEKGKIPRLISGDDKVADLYRHLGFEVCGRWGELYL